MMAADGQPFRPHGIIAGSGIPANGVHGYATMGDVYNNVAIAGSSAGGPQSFQPPPPRVTVWTPGENRIFMEGLQRFCMEPIFDIYAKIAAALPEKTIRDVALRRKWWMTRIEARRIRDGCQNSVIKSHEKERITYPSNSHALPRPHMHNNDNGDARRMLFDLNEDIFKKVGENPQATENIELLYHALNNIVKIMQINDAQEITYKMPPLPVNLNTQLAQFIIQNSNPPYGAQLRQ